MVLKTLLVMIVLGMSNWSCTGFPVYDYDLASLRQALGASVAEVNARSLSPYLFRAFRSSIKRVNILGENSSSLDIEFSVRETTCRRDSGEDPATCDFQSGYYVPAASCRSTVQMSAEQVQDVWVLCHWSSSSESDSSEEISFLTNPDVNSFMNGHMHFSASPLPLPLHHKERCHFHTAAFCVALPPAMRWQPCSPPQPPCNGHSNTFGIRNPQEMTKVGIAQA
ncbi:Secreted phosphoprotein 24 [Myotis brandtii]|uniref:Secreted phosphoprotein 24 n=1 Tax=Myotis brandtii TaxID=109478 RepID=S7PJX3_MYOBR|nr:Secreted phosphoprotein 24 [Myotis brandtii]